MRPASDPRFTKSYLRNWQRPRRRPVMARIAALVVKLLRSI